jgi:hypothetical protein
MRVLAERSIVAKGTAFTSLYIIFQVGQRLEIMTEASGDLDGLISYEVN